MNNQKKKEKKRKEKEKEKKLMRSIVNTCRNQKMLFAVYITTFIEIAEYILYSECK